VGGWKRIGPGYDTSIIKKIRVHPSGKLYSLIDFGESGYLRKLSDTQTYWDFDQSVDKATDF